MGLILDFVPNHMGLDASANAWWRDVLEHGHGSPYADYFDIDWDPVDAGAQRPGAAADSAGRVRRGASSRRAPAGFRGGRLHLQYFATPASHRAALVGRASCAPVSTAHRRTCRCRHAGRPRVPEHPARCSSSCRRPRRRDPDARAGRQQISSLVGERLARLAGRSPLVRSWIDAALASVNGTPGEPATFDRLHDAARAAALSPGPLEDGVRRDQLPALLRHQRSRRASDGGSARVRRGARAACFG